MSAESIPGRLTGFHSAADTPHFRPDPAVLRWMDAELTEFERTGELLGLRPAFVETIVADYLAAFRRVDALPRDDPFWEGTNRRPTKYRMNDFCRSAVQANPLDTWPRQMAVAVRTILGGFVATDWGALIARDRSLAGWMVDAAWIGEFISGDETLPDLIAICHDQDLGPQILPRLRELIASNDPETFHGFHVRQWARKAIDGLNEVRDQ